MSKTWKSSYLWPSWKCILHSELCSYRLHMNQLCFQKSGPWNPRGNERERERNDGGERVGSRQRREGLKCPQQVFEEMISVGGVGCVWYLKFSGKIFTRVCSRRFCNESNHRNLFTKYGIWMLCFPLVTSEFMARDLSQCICMCIYTHIYVYL